MVFLGIDIGTSAVKAVLVDERETVIGEGSAPIPSAEPRPGWSEQNPEDWWRATETAVAAVRQDAPAAFQGVAAIGLSGQMHGVTLLDGHDAPIRPSIIWADSRGVEECAEIEAAVPRLPWIAGVIAMPSFTAPKLRWLGRHEPRSLARARRVPLAKDYVRLRLTGEFATDMGDAAGSLLLDEAKRDWSAPILAAAGIDRDVLPRLLEGSMPSGMLRPALREAWGIAGNVTVAAGAADAAAGAIGIGAVDEGDSFISLGTSAQYFVTRERYEPKPETLIHAFAHALPNRWFEMAAMLNGASPLSWAARTFAIPDIGAVIEQVEARFRGPSRIICLPYLAGERTPLNDPDVRGALFGLDHGADITDIVQAVLEGAAFSLMDAQLALKAAGRSTAPVSLVGGGARSRFWMKLIASAIGLPVLRHAGSEKGPAFGAARLGRMALTGESPATVCAKPPVIETIEPDPALGERYRERFETYRKLYRALRPGPSPRADRLPAAIP
ncbi:MAG: xylulokinase [Rhizobiales bacterium]|nr:xylulokinase [Hyphomicrobiales bacterium]